MKLNTLIGLFIAVVMVAAVSGCGAKSEKDKYMDVMKKVIEYYKSEDILKGDPMQQQKAMQDKMKEIFDASGLELGKTLEEQSTALQALDTKYKDDPDVKKLNDELQKAGEELGRKMMEKMNLEQPPAEPAPEMETPKTDAPPAQGH